MFKYMVVVLFVLFVVPAGASSLEVSFMPKADVTTYRLLLQKPVTKTVGVFGYAQSSRVYSQAYAGVVVSPAPWVEIAAGAGNEAGSNGIRYGGWVWAGKGKLSGLYIREDGGSGHLNKTELRYRATPTVNLGYATHTFFGQGPLIELKASKDCTLKAVFWNTAGKEVSLVTRF